jgi:TP901 family phage tail tape measure protein
MATELGAAYLSLLPSMRDFVPTVKKDLTKAGEQAGAAFDEGFAGGLRKSRRADDEVKRKAAVSKQAADDISRNLAIAGGAAAAGVGIAVKTFADFDKSMSDVRAATHETAAGMGELREAALDAGADTAFSASEAAAGIENLAKAGVTTQDILGGGLTGALDLAAAGGLGVADAAETAATALTQFKLEGEDVPHIADLLAAGAGKAQGEVSDLSAALNQSGLVASQFGLSIEETTGTLAAFASAGLLGSDSGTSFKTMLLALANPSEKAAGLMEDLGIHAYNAQGAFVGIAPLAEQLKTRLGGLSQAQRDSALATIFGSDAIRAANVLYQQGGQGIGDWTTKVNDAGFAAETAAIKQDNLRGDIEKLGGSFETALIGAGSGANDTLRLLTQTAGAAIDGFSGLPDEIQAGATALASVAAVGGLGAAGLLKAVTAASDLKDAWTGLSRTGRTLTFTMGGVGVALAAAAVVYGLFARRNAEAEQKADDLRSTLNEQTGAITGNTRAYVANDLAQSGLAKRAKEIGLNLSLVTDAALGNESALASLVGVLDDNIAAGTLHGNTVNRGATVLTEEARSALALKNELVGTNGALTDAQEKQRLAAEGTQVHKTAQQEQAAALKLSNVEIEKQAEELKKQVEAAYEAAGLALGLRDAQNRYRESLVTANTALAENGRGVSLNTKEGRANRTAIDGVAEAANTLTKSMLDNGQSNAAAAAQAVASRKNFVDLAVGLGYSKAEAKRLSLELIAVPKTAKTDVQNNAAAAKAKAVDYRVNGLENLPATVYTGITNSAATAKAAVIDYKTNGLNNLPASKNLLLTNNVPLAKKQITDFGVHVDRTLGGIADESIRVSLAYTSALSGGRLGKNPEGKATGGGVFGPGTGTSDSIHAMLSNGEHVWTADEVAAAGGHSAVESLRKSVLHGFRAGGPVDVQLATSTPSLASIAGVAQAVAGVFGREIARAKQAGPLGFAHSQEGKPYIWGGVGPAGYDCSGFMSAITNVILGRSPHSRLFATGSFPTDMFAPGFGNFSIGSVRGNPGHMAGTLNGVPVESRGGDGVIVGAGARGAGHPMFSGVHHLRGYFAGGAVEGDLPYDIFDPRGKHFQMVRPKVFDDGGKWRSGELGINLSGRTETVRTDKQEANLRRPVIVENHIEIGGEVVRVVRTEIGSEAEFESAYGRARGVRS